MPEHLPILYRDDHLIAAHKPAGLLVHRSDIDRHETRFAVQLMRDQIGQHVWPAHRLDRGTSGILLFALDADTASAMARKFEQGLVAKTYLAIVRGFTPETGTIDHALSRQPDRREWRGADAATEPQPACTRFRRLACAEIPVEIDRYPSSRYSLVELAPQTGRRHQLRRHMKHIAHPIIGDATHGKGRHNRFFAEHFGCTRLLLACTGLAFSHPVTRDELPLKTPPADDFVDVAAQLGWSAVIANLFS